MTSPTPLLYDTYYHIYNRGVNRGNIFFEERNYDLFLKLYEKYLSAVTDLFVYCMLKNHFHFGLRVKSEEEIKETLRVSFAINHLTGQGSFANPGEDQSRKCRHGATATPLGSNSLGSCYVSDQFSHFFNAYAKTINKAYDRTGSLFQHPFGRVPITTDRQFWNVIAYIHQNPQKHRFVRDFRDWKWSSYGMIMAEKPTKVKRNAVLDWFGGKENYLELHKQWVSEADAKWFAEEDYD